MPTVDGCAWCWRLLPAAQQPGAAAPEPFVRVGVSYPSGLSRYRERAAADLEAIYTLGFNSHSRPIEWAGGRASPRAIPIRDVDQTLELAGRAGLKVVLRLDTASPPSGCFVAIRTAGLFPRLS